MRKFLSASLVLTDTGDATSEGHGFADFGDCFAGAGDTVARRTARDPLDDFTESLPLDAGSVTLNVISSPDSEMSEITTPV